MTPELAKAIVDVNQSIGFHTEIYKDYSGRKMYGKTTTGVVINYDYPAWLLTLPTDWLSKYDISELRHDNLGKQYILY